MEKNLEKDKCVCVCIYIYIYTYMNHFAVHLRLTQHCKSTVLQLKKKTSDTENILEYARATAGCGCYLAEKKCTMDFESLVTVIKLAT